MPGKPRKPELPDQYLLRLLEPVKPSSLILAVTMVPAATSGLLCAEGEPTNFRATTPFLRDRVVELAWEDNCDDEIHYAIAVRPEGGEWTEVAISPPNSTLFFLTGGAPNITASFRVRAVRPDNSSEWTTPIELTLPSDLAIESGRFVGGTVGEPLAGPALDIFTNPPGGSAENFSVSDLPEGWEFNTATGVITGTPSAPGIYRPIVSATDGTHTVSTFVTFRVKPATSGPIEETPVPDVLLLSSAPGGAVSLDLSPHFRDPDTSTAIRLETNLGEVEAILYPEACPAHVENLLNYIDRGDYDGVVFHRSAVIATSGVDVVQAGLMKPDGNEGYTSVVLDPSVVDEPAFSNLTGTLAMAKNDRPNSGSSQVYFNTIDNISLDGPRRNGGYTVFGRATTGSLPILADMHARPRGNYELSLDGVSQTFRDLPTLAAPVGELPTIDELHRVIRAQQITQFLSYRLGSTSNPELALVSVNGTELTIKPIPGRTGTTTLTVEVSDLDGSVLQVEIFCCILDLEFTPILSSQGHPAATFLHEDPAAGLDYEVQSSLNGESWTSVWQSTDGLAATPVIGNVDLGSARRLTVEDVSITSPTDHTAFLRIVVTKAP